MAKVQHIGKARGSKFTRRCTVCGHEVQSGEAYKRIEKKTGPTSGYSIIFCGEHSPSPSHFLSGREAELAQIIEAFEDTLNNVSEDDEIKDVVESSLEEIEEFASSLRDGADNMEAGFGHATAQSENMSQSADDLDEWRSELESLAESGDDECNEDVVSQLRDMLGGVPDLNVVG